VSVSFEIRCSVIITTTTTTTTTDALPPLPPESQFVIDSCGTGGGNPNWYDMSTGHGQRGKTSLSPDLSKSLSDD
jgi:hypothetical protein